MSSEKEKEALREQLGLLTELLELHKLKTERLGVQNHSGRRPRPAPGHHRHNGGASHQHFHQMAYVHHDHHGHPSHSMPASSMHGNPACHGHRSKYRYQLDKKTHHAKPSVTRHSSGPQRDCMASNTYHPVGTSTSIKAANSSHIAAHRHSIADDVHPQAAKITPNVAIVHPQAAKVHSAAALPHSSDKSGNIVSRTVASSQPNKNNKLTGASKTINRRVVSVSEKNKVNSLKSQQSRTSNASQLAPNQVPPAVSMPSVSTSSAKSVIVMSKSQASQPTCPRQLSSSAAVHLLSKKKKAKAANVHSDSGVTVPAASASSDISHPTSSVHGSDAVQVNTSLEKKISITDSECPSGASCDSLVPSKIDRLSPVTVTEEKAPVKVHLRSCDDIHLRADCLRARLVADSGSKLSNTQQTNSPSTSDGLTLSSFVRCAGRQSDRTVILPGSVAADQDTLVIPPQTLEQTPQETNNAAGSSCLVGLEASSKAAEPVTSPCLNIVPTSIAQLLSDAGLKPSHKDSIATVIAQSLLDTRLNSSHKDSISTVIAQSLVDAGLKSSHKDSISTVIAQSLVDVGLNSSHKDSISSVIEESLLDDRLDTCCPSSQTSASEKTRDKCEQVVASSVSRDCSSDSSSNALDDACSIIDPPPEPKPEVVVIDDEDDDDLLLQLRHAALRTMQESASKKTGEAQSYLVCSDELAKTSSVPAAGEAEMIPPHSACPHTSGDLPETASVQLLSQTSTTVLKSPKKSRSVVSALLQQESVALNAAGTSPVGSVTGSDSIKQTTSAVPVNLHTSQTSSKRIVCLPKPKPTKPGTGGMSEQTGSSGQVMAEGSTYQQHDVPHTSKTTIINTTTAKQSANKVPHSSRTTIVNVKAAKQSANEVPHSSKTTIVNVKAAKQSANEVPHSSKTTIVNVKAAKQSVNEECLKRVALQKVGSSSRTVKLSQLEVKKMLLAKLHESSKKALELRRNEPGKYGDARRGIQNTGPLGLSKSSSLPNLSERGSKVPGSSNEVVVRTNYKLVRQGGQPAPAAPTSVPVSSPPKQSAKPDPGRVHQQSPMKSIGKYKVVRRTMPTPSTSVAAVHSDKRSVYPSAAGHARRPTSPRVPVLKTKYKLVLGKSDASGTPPHVAHRKQGRVSSTPPVHGSRVPLHRYPAGRSPLASFKQQCSRRAVKRAMQHFHQWKMPGNMNDMHPITLHHAMLAWQPHLPSFVHPLHFSHNSGPRRSMPRKGRRTPRGSPQQHRRQKMSSAKSQGKSNLMWKGPYNLRRDNSDCMSINQLLGRHVNNVSKSRYKFIKGRETQSRLRQDRRQRLKVDHRRPETRQSSSQTSSGTAGRRGGHLVLIGGVAYRASPTHLAHVKRQKRRPTVLGGKYIRRHSGLRAVSVRGMMFNVSKSGRAIRRMSNSQAQGASGHKPASQPSNPYSLVHTVQSASQRIASRSLHRSKTTAAKSKLRLNRKQKQFCMFYNRFGKCNRGDKCPYAHDPDKIAVCTRYLRGTCKVVDCPFSHKVAPEKMPVCSHYLRGVCSREACPYLHVNVGRDAEVCQDFIKGYCPRGAQCKRQHTLVCPQWVRSGTCAKNRTCGMRHPSLRKRKRSGARHSSSVHDKKGEAAWGSTSTTVSNQQVKKSRIITVEDNDDVTLPLSQRQLPAFIALNSSISRRDPSQPASHSTEPLQIRPNLSFDES